MLAVRRFSVCIRRFEQFLACNPAVTICNLFRSGDHDALTLLNDLHKLRRLNKRVHRAGVQPRIAAAEQLHVKRTVLKIHAVEVGDFQLAARGRFDLLCQLHDTLVVEIQAGNRIVRFRLFGFLFNRNHVTCLVKFHDTETLRVINIITEYSRLTVLCRLCRSLQALTQARTIEDVVTEHHRTRLIANKFLAKRKRLRKTVRRRLHLVRQIDTIAAAISEQTLETLMLVALPCVAVFLSVKKDFGRDIPAEERPVYTPRQELLRSALIGLVFGCYDGLVGPGTGTFMILGFTALLSLDLITAGGCAKASNLASCAASAVVWILHGQVLWALAIPALACSIAGNYLGALYAIRGGSKKIRSVMFLVLGLLFVKMLYELLF